jgi:hypothetical protein
MDLWNETVVRQEAELGGGDKARHNGAFDVQREIRDGRVPTPKNWICRTGGMASVGAIPGRRGRDAS